MIRIQYQQFSKISFMRAERNTRYPSTYTYQPRYSSNLFARSMQQQAQTYGRQEAGAMQRWQQAFSINYSSVREQRCHSRYASYEERFHPIVNKTRFSTHHNEQYPQSGELCARNRMNAVANKGRCPVERLNITQTKRNSSGPKRQIHHNKSKNKAKKKGQAEDQQGRNPTLNSGDLPNKPSEKKKKMKAPQESQKEQLKEPNPASRIEEQKHPPSHKAAQQENLLKLLKQNKAEIQLLSRNQNISVNELKTELKTIRQHLQKLEKQVRSPKRELSAKELPANQLQSQLLYSTSPAIEQPGRKTKQISMYDPFQMNLNEIDYREEPDKLHEREQQKRRFVYPPANRREQDEQDRLHNRKKEQYKFSKIYINYSQYRQGEGQFREDKEYRQGAQEARQEQIRRQWQMHKQSEQSQTMKEQSQKYEEASLSPLLTDKKSSENASPFRKDKQPIILYSLKDDPLYAYLYRIAKKNQSDLKRNLREEE